MFAKFAQANTGAAAAQRIEGITITHLCYFDANPHGPPQFLPTSLALPSPAPLQ